MQVFDEVYACCNFCSSCVGMVKIKIKAHDIKSRLFRDQVRSCLKGLLITGRKAGAYPEIFKRGGRNLKPRQLKLFLVGQAFSLVSAYARLRLPTCAFCHISPFNTLIFFIVVYLGFR